MPSAYAYYLNEKMDEKIKNICKTSGDMQKIHWMIQILKLLLRHQKNYNSNRQKKKLSGVRY